MRILDRLGVTEPAWTTLMGIARQASEHGWWESAADQMGTRQALYANLQAGAATIREYQMTLLPGLLQTPRFAAARAGADVSDWSTRFDPARAMQARTGRQRMLHRVGGPVYEVVIDEVAVRRPAAPGCVLHDQLLHFADLARTNPKITVRVLPVNARIPGYTVPRSAFSIYTYPDPDDPRVAAVDTVTDDLVLTDSTALAHYTDLYDRLRQAALSPTESIQFLADTADSIPDPTRRAA